jgi:hypothetical protein
LHLLNYTNPTPIEDGSGKLIPWGQQTVRVQVAADKKVTRVELLRSAHDIPFHTTGQHIEFVIPRIDDYEVADLHCVWPFACETDEASRET